MIDRLDTAPLWSEHRSLILKHAPPFIAGIGPKAPFNVRRQEIEATLLRLFSCADQTTPRLGVLANNPLVSIPKLVKHDEDHDVLIMTDLGELPNLSDVFTDLGGGLPGGTSSTYAATHAVWNANEAAFSNLGQRLGNFFADLHSPRTLAEARMLLSEMGKDLSNPAARDIVLEGAIKPVGDQLKRFPDLVDADEAARLFGILVDDFRRENNQEEESLVLGDCWTGAILVSAPSGESETGTDKKSMKIGVIDWEFASVGRGAHGDMAQFLAHLELLSISAFQSSRFVTHQSAIETLMDSMISTYRERSAHQVTRQSQSSTAGNDLGDDDGSLRYTKAARSALLCHGAEIINNAFWKKWRCVRSDCPLWGTPHSDEARIHECTLIKNMVMSGLQCLRMAMHKQTAVGHENGHPFSRAASAPGSRILDLFHDNNDRSDRLFEESISVPRFDNSTVEPGVQSVRSMPSAIVAVPPV